MGVFVAHADFTLWVFLWLTQISLFLLMVGNLTEALRFVVFVGSHGFREIQQEDYLWEFVLIRGFKAKLQIFTNYFWVKWSVSQ